MLAVCAGLIMLFVGTWTLVKKASPATQKEAASASASKQASEIAPNAKKEQAKSPTQADQSKSSPAEQTHASEITKTQTTESKPVPQPHPEIAANDSPSAVTPVMTAPQLELDPKSKNPSVASESAPPPSVEAMLNMRVPDSPTELSPPTSPDPETPSTSPAPAPESMAAAQPSAPMEMESGKKEENKIEPVTSPDAVPNVAFAPPSEIHGPPPPELQPSPIKIPENIDPKDPPYPTPADEPTPMPMEVAAETKGSSKNSIKDVTDSKASHHDMEAEPEDGPINQPATITEKTTNITPTTSSSMPGWELLRYGSRDYITADSIHNFYRFSRLKVDGKNVWFTSPQLIMKAYIGSQELLINNIKFVMSYPVIVLNNKPCFSRLDLCKLIDPVLRPSYIDNAKPFDTVVIDPGHGGSDSGARGIYGYEKDFALKLGLLLKKSLEQRGLKVVMTRSTDVFIPLASRVAIANKTPNSIYISLHYNSGGSSATGIETFALTPQGSSSIYGSRNVDSLAFEGNQLDSQNIALATAVHAAVVDHFKFVDRGVKRARWRVLTTLKRPGILFEGGFVTNSNDGRLIAADNYRQEMANTIARAVINYRNALNPRRATSR